MTNWDPNQVRLDVARDLRAIVEMCGRLDEEAVEGAMGRDPSDVDALNLLGPAANIEAWQHRYESAEAAAGGDFHSGPGGADYASDQVAELHPLLVLATWEDALREELDQPTDLRATVERAADYIASKIDWALSDDENGDINFLGIDALATDLRDCKSMLENVLTEGFRADTGAPCIECSKPLTKFWRESEATDQWRCRSRDCKEYDEPVSVGRYSQAVRAGYLANSDKLTATDMLDAYRIKAGTLTGWASKGLVRKRGKDDSGRILYDVSDAVKQRDQSERTAVGDAA